MDIYTQIPRPHFEVIPPEGIVITKIPAVPGRVNLLKALYVDLLSGQTISVQVDDNVNWMYFSGPKQGGIPFRCGIQFVTSVIVTITGTAGTKVYAGVVTNV